MMTPRRKDVLSNDDIRVAAIPQIVFRKQAPPFVLNLNQMRSALKVASNLLMSMFPEAIANKMFVLCPAHLMDAISR